MMVETPDVWQLWERALQMQIAYSRSSRQDGVDFDEAHKVSAFMIEHFFGVLCHKAGIKVPVAFGSELFSSDVSFNGRTHKLAEAYTPLPSKFPEIDF